MKGLKGWLVSAVPAGIAAFWVVLLMGAWGFAQESEEPVFGEDGFTMEIIDEENREIQFTCSASDPDGQVVNYTIDYGDGNTETSTGGFFQHAYTDTGEFWATCTATDDAGMESTAGPHTINILPAGPGSEENAAPAITSFEAQWVNRELRQAKFTCTADDPDGQVVRYTLDPGVSGGEESNATGIFHHTYSGTGTFSAYCTVTDNEDATRTTGPVNITVTAENDDPIDGDDGDTNNCFIGSAGK